MSPTRPLHLAVALDGPARYDAEYYAGLARLAEQGALDFVTLGDSFARPGLDALAVLSRVAPTTERIGLVPTVTTTHTEPFHVSTAVATLDWVSRGRAGWQVDVSTTEAEARLFGRRPATPGDALWREAGEVADVAARLWDSWEDDAEIRDISTGRFIDRDKLHRVDFQGGTFSVRGPSIVPRPPQGRPVTVADGTGSRAGTRPPGTPTSFSYGRTHPSRPPRSATTYAGAPRRRAVTRTRCASWSRSSSTWARASPDWTVTLDSPAVRTTAAAQSTSPS